MGRQRAGFDWAHISGGSYGGPPSYYEHAGGYREGIRESDVIEWPDIVVTESDMPEPEIPLTEGEA